MIIIGDKMTIEKNISDLKEAFRLYIELRKEDEVNLIMERDSYPEDSRSSIEQMIDRRYETITDILRDYNG